ncbi:hypothetical protein [Ectobacillus sp. sgz5001026]|uniref:hypothetical protein n=1 Tax=Ectobacillus sp. sgz5001026 TaxID=3242473 RepID=UPI0036D34F8D
MRLIVLLPLFITIVLLQKNPAHAETEKNPLESQITSFMTGLHVQESKQAVELWILGVQNRSGAFQFAMLSPSFQQNTRKQFEQRGWVTGVSSPLFDNFLFVKVNKLSDSKIQYTVVYDLLSSYANFGKGQKIITVEKNPVPHMTNWLISSIITKYSQ